MMSFGLLVASDKTDDGVGYQESLPRHSEPSPGRFSEPEGHGRGQEGWSRKHSLLGAISFIVKVPVKSSFKVTRRC
jgi:hypothetical protein